MPLLILFQLEIVMPFTTSTCRVVEDVAFGLFATSFLPTAEEEIFSKFGIFEVSKFGILKNQGSTLSRRINLTFFQWMLWCFWEFISFAKEIFAFSEVLGEKDVLKIQGPFSLFCFFFPLCCLFLLGGLKSSSVLGGLLAAFAEAFLHSSQRASLRVPWTVSIYSAKNWIRPKYFKTGTEAPIPLVIPAVFGWMLESSWRHHLGRKKNDLMKRLSLGWELRCPDSVTAPFVVCACSNLSRSWASFKIHTFLQRFSTEMER